LDLGTRYLRHMTLDASPHTNYLLILKQRLKRGGFRRWFQLLSSRHRSPLV
jgi:hypothetical protein